MAITEPSVRTTEIDGLLVLTPKTAEDERGAIRELFRKSVFSGRGLPSFGPPLQVNLTYTRQGAIRGLHGEATTKLVGVAAGTGFGAYIDLRPASPSFGVVVTLELDPSLQVLVPVGVCNGFQALSTGGCGYLYCFDSEWSAGMAGRAVYPLDPDLAIAWPIAVDPSDRSMLSAKDASLPRFAELSGGGSPPAALGG